MVPSGNIILICRGWKNIHIHRTCSEHLKKRSGCINKDRMLSNMTCFKTLMEKEKEKNKARKTKHWSWSTLRFRPTAYQCLPHAIWQDATVTCCRSSVAPGFFVSCTILSCKSCTGFCFFAVSSSTWSGSLKKYVCSVWEKMAFIKKTVTTVKDCDSLFWWFWFDRVIDLCDHLF